MHAGTWSLTTVILLTCQAFAQGQDLVLKKVDPNYGDLLKQPSMTVPIAVQVTVSAGGRAYEIESFDGGIEPSVYRALKEYRFRKEPGGLLVDLTLPVKRALDSFSPTQRLLKSPESSVIEAASKLNDLEALRLERGLSSKPGDDSRAILLAYSASHDGSVADDLRVRQLTWLIQKDPASAILRSSVATLSRNRDTGRYAAIRQVWTDALTKEPNNRHLLLGIANFLSISEPEEALTLLFPAANRSLALMEAYGELLGLSAAGVTGIDPLSGRAISARTAISPAVTVARGHLTSEGQLPFLLAGYSAMNRAARSLQAAGLLPPRYEEFCPTIWQKLKRLQPSFDDDCQSKAPGVIELSEEVMRGKRTKSVGFTTPPRLIEGEGDLTARIGKDGRVVEVRYVKGQVDLLEDFAKLVRQWEFEPSTMAGRAVEVNTTVHFSLRFSGRVKVNQ